MSKPPIPPTAGNTPPPDLDRDVELGIGNDIVPPAPDGPPPKIPGVFSDPDVGTQPGPR